MTEELLRKAKKKFASLIEEQLKRIEEMKKPPEIVNYSKLSPIIIGFCAGDGIGPVISHQAQTVLSHILKDELTQGKIVFCNIAGLTIENRVKHRKAVPDEVLEKIKACHVILKGPTTTPQVGSKWPNIESANVALRRHLDLFANVRPIKIPQQKIDWCFFRENTEDAYILGSQGFDVSEDLSVDFKIITEQGAERIIRLAFEYAKKNNLDRLTVVTKSNVIKTTDGRFSKVAFRIAAEYPQIKVDEWYIDIMAAKLLDSSRHKDFKVFVLPNLYGDILTEEAAQLQGGVGTAGSANIGYKWAMFEAIHGSAPRMVEEGRDKFADPSSIIRAASMLLKHIGYFEAGEKVEMALDVCGQFEKKVIVTGRDTGVSSQEYTEYLLSWIDNPGLKAKWESYLKPTRRIE